MMKGRLFGGDDYDVGQKCPQQNKLTWEGPEEGKSGGTKETRAGRI